jgi:biopolymer transport protein ExbD
MGMNVGSASDDDSGGVMVDINTTPLIDVMLVLLIMFIITIPIQTHAVKMNMPVPNPNQVVPPKPPEIVRIDVDFDGTIGWNGEVIQPGDRAAIEQRLAALAALPDQPEVHLRPNKLVEYKHVAMIMATAQRLGVTKIGIVGNEQFL